MSFLSRWPRWALRSALVVGLSTIAWTGSAAQDSTSRDRQIVTTGVGESSVVPDRAAIMFAVETRAQTAAAAGSDNARLQSAVIAALRGKGVLAEHITTSGYSLSPNERYDSGQRRVLGYIARNFVIVDVQNVSSIGTLIDAALGAGANSIGGLRYYSTRIETIRRAALESAVAHAKADAEVMARAAGGTLGGPLEITQVSDGVFPRSAMMDQVVLTAAREGAPTPVEVGEQKVTVRVSTRWLFVPGR
jgi:uncharacterized protein YggE